jgi:hypothetical protein
MSVDISQQSVGIALEPAFAQFTAPNRFIPFEGVSVDPGSRTQEFAGQKFGQIGTPIDNYVTSPDGGAGNINGLLPDIGFTDNLLEAAFGARATNVVGLPPLYTRKLYTPADTGPSLTIQKVVPMDNGVYVDTYTGSVVKSMNISGVALEAMKFDSQFDTRKPTALPANTAGLVANGTVGVHTVGSAPTATTLTVTGPIGWIEVGMSLFTGVTLIGTITAISAAGVLTTSAPHGLAAAAVIRIGRPMAPQAYALAANPFVLSEGQVSISFDTGSGGPQEVCFAEFSIAYDAKLEGVQRFCPKGRPQRTGQPEVLINLRNAEHNIKFRELHFGNTNISFSLLARSTFDSNTTFKWTSPACRLTDPKGRVLSASQLTLTDDVTLKAFAPNGGAPMFTSELVSL